jgi:hypothetical protein
MFEERGETQGSHYGIIDPKPLQNVENSAYPAEDTLLAQHL